MLLEVGSRGRGAGPSTPEVPGRKCCLEKQGNLDLPLPLPRSAGNTLSGESPQAATMDPGASRGRGAGRPPRPRSGSGAGCPERSHRWEGARSK